LQDLQDFLDLYYAACNVLRKEQDFYDLMYAYLRRAAIDNVYVAEIFFDPQTHTERGVPYEVVVTGLHRALIDGYMDFGIKGSLILCFLRHLSQESAIDTLEQAKPHLDKIIGVGLDSGEVGNPPKKFKEVYKMAADLGLKLVAHAGEEAGPSYIREALDVLHVRRVEHGVRCLEDDELVQRLKQEEIPLTTCPMSNRKLKVNACFFNDENVTRKLLEKGLKVTINSDDPAYFGGYITENFLTTALEVRLTEAVMPSMLLSSPHLKNTTSRRGSTSSTLPWDVPHPQSPSLSLALAGPSRARLSTKAVPRLLACLQVGGSEWSMAGTTD